MCQTRDLEKRCVLGSSKWTLHITSKVTSTVHNTDFVKVRFWCFVSRLNFSKSLVYRVFRPEVENDL